MNTLERVMQMQQQGYAEADISRQLQNEGIGPAEINDAFNQSRIKTAVAGAQENIQEPLPPEPPAPVPPTPPAQTGPPPIPPPLEEAPSPAREYAAPAPQEAVPVQQQAPQTQEYADQYAQAPAEDYYPQTPQAYADQGYAQDYYAPAAVDSETISEIASQVVSEKIEEFKKETGDVKGFQEQIEEKVKRIDDRLKKIEDSLNHITQSIIGKIGEFGQSSALIHKDLDNLHDTVSKLMGKTIDHHKKGTHHRTHHAKKKKK